MSQENPTPRTDEAVDAGGDVSYNFAAQLERELNEARHNLILKKMECEKLVGELAVEKNRTSQAHKELAEWKEIIKDFHDVCMKKSSVIFL